jgi:hypothetical protein
MYSSNNPFIIYCNSCWWSDKWNFQANSRGYDFSKPFFQQFLELSKKVPRPALYQKNQVNSPYTNHSDHVKNSYLTFDSGFVEEVMYSKWMVKCRDVLDSYGTSDSELSYMLQDSKNCSRSYFLFYCDNCIDSQFLYDCRGCSNCFLSVNLRNKSYYFENRQLSKEEYLQKLNSLNLGSYKSFLQIQEKFRKILLSIPQRFATFHRVVNSTGNNLYDCKNLKQSFHVYESEDSAYCADAANLKDCYDVYESAFNCQLQYDSHACNRVNYSKFASISYDNHNIEYSEICHNSSNLFGCISLRNKQYCILNKQYTKSEYESLVPKIIEHMNKMPYVDKKGRVYKYGEFFPPELSPFAYNETIAQEYFPLTKEQALAQGYKWRDPDTRNYHITKKTEDLPDHIKDVPDSIVNEIIQCAHAKPTTDNRQLTTVCNEQCATAFKIIPEELQFYRRMNLPLPRLCPNCRHYQRLKQRNPLKLWHRKCMCQGKYGTNNLQLTTYNNTVTHFHGDQPCPNEFETSYAPDRKEIVYCEECYNAEVV